MLQSQQGLGNSQPSTVGISLIDMMLGACGWVFLKPVRKLSRPMGIIPVFIVTAHAGGNLDALI